MALPAQAGGIDAMKTIAEDLRRAVLEAVPRIVELGEAESARPLALGQWCPREVIGHLIDSASNKLTPARPGAPPGGGASVA
jgi:hypothetical protein